MSIEPGRQRVLVTGAAGFIGGAVLSALRDAGYSLRATWHLRAPPSGFSDVDWRQADLAAQQDGSHDLLRDVDAVVHLAARVHVTGPSRYRSAPFARLNALATQRLATQATRAGVRRFVFLSTVGVHGNGNRLESGMPRPLRDTDPLRPANPYARSKLAAEAALAEACTGSAMQFVNLRPALVFGPGNGGNFLRLMRWLDRGLPLPVGPRAAPRSMAYVGNLAALIALCIRHPGVAGHPFLVSDHDVTVTALAGKLAGLLGRRLRTLPLPAWLPGVGPLRAVTQPLLVDSQPIRSVTGWEPAIGLDEALARTVAWYRSGART